MIFAIGENGVKLAWFDKTDMKPTRFVTTSGMAVLLTLFFTSVVQAGPYYRGGWGGGWGGYHGGYCGGYYGGWGVPLAVGAGVGLLGAAAAYNYAAWNPPVYGAPAYTAPVYYQTVQQVAEVQQTAPPAVAPSGTLAKVQAKLAGLGYYKGPVDGNFGPLTTQAVEQFQGDNSLPVSGRLDLKTLSSLGIAP